MFKWLKIISSKGIKKPATHSGMKKQMKQISKNNLIKMLINSLIKVNKYEKKYGKKFY